MLKSESLTKSKATRQMFRCELILLTHST